MLKNNNYTSTTTNYINKKIIISNHSGKFSSPPFWVERKFPPHPLITHRLALDEAVLQVGHVDDGRVVHPPDEPVVVPGLRQVAQVHDGEGDELVVEDDKLEVLLVKEAVGHANLMESTRVKRKKLPSPFYKFSTILLFSELAHLRFFSFLS